MPALRPRVVFALFLVLCSLSAFARSPKHDGDPKVSSQLANAAKDYAAKGNRGKALLHGVEIDDAGEARVRVRFAEGTNVESLRGRFRASHKAEIEKVRGTMARMRIPLAAVDGLARAFPEIVQIYIPAPPQPLSVRGEGVVATGANRQHSRGWDGDNTKIMVIDLGFAGINEAQASNDLPWGPMMDCVGGCDSTTFSNETEKHGTAVAEIVHEMAPGATLYYTKISDDLDLADAVDMAASEGIDIITMSLGWLNSNFYDGKCWFGGPVCSTDEAIVTHGILWINSAGNQARRHYDAVFTDANNDGNHDTTVRIPAAAGQWITLYATWNAWPTTALDFDMGLYDPSGNLVAESANWQTGGAGSTPVETIFVQAASTGTYQLRFYKYDAENGVRFKVHSWHNDFANPIVGSSITAPADGKYVVSVAAVRASEYTSAAGLEPYSSRGPTAAGVIAPTISAPTVITTNTMSGFNGTSAAAPHVAGAAAVLLGKNPTWKWSDLWAGLVTTAIDMGSPNPDTSFGYGRLNLCTAPTQPWLEAPASAPDGQPYSLTWSNLFEPHTVELQEATNPNFTGAQTFNPVGTSFQFIKSLGMAGTYYYRMRVHMPCNGGTVTGDWSPIRSVVQTVPNTCTLTNISQPEGETWVAGGQVTVRWTKTAGCSANAGIDLFEQWDTVRATIATPTANDGAELWSIPSSLPGGWYKIRIVDRDTGSSVFKNVLISAAPTGTRPPRADFNGDGIHDILWRNKDTGQVWLSPVKNGVVTGGQMLYTDPNPAWRIIGAADFDADSASDILRRNFTTGQVEVQRFSRYGVLQESRVIWTDANPAWSVVDLADVDGDWRADVVWRSSSTGQIFILLMSGMKVKASGVVHTEGNLSWQLVATTDMNGDGKADLLYRNSSTGAVYIVYLNGLLAPTKGTFNESRGTAWTLAATGDVDGDRDSDLLWRHNTTGEVWATLVNGLNVAASARIWSEGNPNWRIHGMADFDGNGREDILWRNSTTGVLFLVRLNGLSVVGSRVIYAESKLAWKIVAPTTSAAARDGNISP